MLFDFLLVLVITFDCLVLWDWFAGGFPGVGLVFPVFGVLDLVACGCVFLVVCWVLGFGVFPVSR